VFVDERGRYEKFLAKYENWLWSNRDIIRQYFKKRVDQRKMWADHEVLLNKIMSD